MPIQTMWGNADQTVILVTFSEMWTLDEYYASVDTMFALTTSVAHTVHSISDFSKSFAPPSRLLSTGQHIENCKTVNSGINIIVGAKGFIIAMLQIAQRLYLIDMPIYLANSIEEGYNIIQTHQEKASLSR
jgi:hypothetical protein